jgi:hypothetical protein
MYLGIPLFGLVVWILGYVVERYERYSADTLSPSELREQVAAYIETIKRMSPGEARGSRTGFLSRVKGTLNVDQSRGSVFKWIGGGTAVGGLFGPIAAVVVAFVAGMFLGRKYHEMLGRNRILPIVEALDRVAASDATT